MNQSKTRSCDGKVRYETRSGAVMRAQSLLRKEFPDTALLGKSAFRRFRKEFFDAYECAFCGGFHTGHVPKQIRESYEDVIPKTRRTNA